MGGRLQPCGRRAEATPQAEACPTWLLRASLNCDYNLSMIHLSRSARLACAAILSVLGSLEAFQATRNSLTEFSGAVRALTQKVSPAVVQVLVSGYGSLDEGEGKQVSLLTRQRSTGSGVVVDSSGYIITNAHVVRGAVNVRVSIPAMQTAGADTPLDAKIVGVDRGTDLALLKVD